MVKGVRMSATQEWFYSHDGNQVGPVSAGNLKRLASTGQLSPSDLIWKEGWEDWKPAGAIKGLFADASPSKPVPPPLPETTDATASRTSGNVSDAVKSDLSDLMTTAKKAKDYAVAQTQKTQITQITLPKAYLALGKKLFDEGRFKEEFADLFQRISVINAEIDKVMSGANERPQATDLKGKLQSGAASLLAQGQAAKLSLQRDSQLRALGKKAFELHGSQAGTPDVVSPITEALDALQKIDARIAESSSGENVPLWQRMPVAAFLTICCFPVGLYLLWHNPRISRRTKFIWGGGFVCLMILGGIMNRIEIENAKAELAAAHQLWSSGDEPAAISKYREVAKSHLSAIPKSDRSLILGRVIDFDAESGNAYSAQELLKKAHEEHIIPSVSSERGRSLIDIHSASTEAERGLTADYMLMAPGQTTSFAVQMFGQTGDLTFRETAKSDKLIEGESSEDVSVPGVTLKPITQKYTIRIRVSGGFAECSHRGIESDLKIKVGAKPGDEWDGNDKTKNERFRFVGFRDNESQIGRAPASAKRALIELRQHQGTIRVRTEYLLEKGHGVVGIKMIDEGNGEHHECVFEMKKIE